MKLKRIIRDVLVLALLCGSFYASTIVVGQFESEHVNQKDTNFSDERLEGDKLSLEEDWVESAKRYRRITEADPFNGYAWRRLGRCYSIIRSNQKKEINAEESAEAPSERKLDELKASLLATDQLALKAWEKAREHPRYRRVALFQLAVIRAGRSELEESLALLEEFVVTEGYIVQQNLYLYREFGNSKIVKKSNETDFEAEHKDAIGLHQFARFWEIAKHESEFRFATARPVQVFSRGMSSPGQRN